MRISDDPGDALVAYLEQIGVTPNEAKTYLALLNIPAATAAELGEAAQVPRSKVYSITRSLEDKGFAVALGGQVVRFQAVDAEPALRGWLAHREYEREIDKQTDQRVVSDLVRLLPRTSAETDDEPSAYLEAVFGRARISETSEEMIGSARERLLMVQQPPYFQPPSRWNLLELDAVDRGVDVRVLYNREAIEDPSRYRPLLQSGALLKVTGKATMKLIVSDGKRALVALRDPLSGKRSVRSAAIYHPDLVSAVESLFDREWERSEGLVVDKATD